MRHDSSSGESRSNIDDVRDGARGSLDDVDVVATDAIEEMYIRSSGAPERHDDALIYFEFLLLWGRFRSPGFILLHC